MIITEKGRLLVIIPTIRNGGVIKDYIDNAILHRFKLSSLFFLVLTEDFVDKRVFSQALRDAGVEGDVLNQLDREKMLQTMGLSEYSDVFPRKSHAETSFGLFYLQANLSDYRCGVFIDDDTRPLAQTDYFGTHIRNLEYRGKITSLSSNTKWVNVLYRNFAKHHLYPRGFPYSAMGELTERAVQEATQVVLSQGLWTNIPDLDAVRILMDGDLNGQARTRLTVDDYDDLFTVGIGNYLTICSMNLAFRKEIIPAFYQFKMDDNPWRIGRFDDIWSGVVAKKVADSFGWTITSGAPLCEHNKAPRSTFKDLRSEAPGLEANERFFQVVDKTSVTDEDILERVERIADALIRDSDEFISFNGKYLTKWVGLIRAIS
jgi:hypothetical protein